MLQTGAVWEAAPVWVNLSGAGGDEPGFGGVAVGALSAWVVVGAGVAGFAVGVARVVEVDVCPTVYLVAGSAFAGPMACGRGMAGGAGVNVGVVEEDVVPLVGGVAGGAFAGPMVFGDGVAGGAVGQVGVAEGDV